MKRIIFFMFVIVSLFTSCLNSRQEPLVLLEDFTEPKEMHPEWQELFTDRYTITPLETNSKCLVGQIDKIKKFAGHYYISSSFGQSLLLFDEHGKFVASLQTQGQGPEEYLRIEDFDIYQIDEQAEVWISDNKNLKIYDAINFEFKYKIPLPFVIHKFRRLDNSHILLVTGQNEHILTLTDQQGNILSEYLEKEIPYLMFRAVQFVHFGDEYLFQLGISNAYVAFNPNTETFRNGVFTKSRLYLSDKQLLELFDKYGTDFITEANKSTYINNIVSLNDILWIQSCHAGTNYLTKIQNDKIISTEFTYGTVLSTITDGEGENSILLHITPEQLSDYGKDVFDKFGKKINCNVDDNPCILEFY